MFFLMSPRSALPIFWSERRLIGGKCQTPVVAPSGSFLTSVADCIARLTTCSLPIILTGVDEEGKAEEKTLGSSPPVILTVLDLFRKAEGPPIAGKCFSLPNIPAILP